MELGQNLKMIREKKGLLQSELAEMIGTNQRNISRWEREERTSNAEYIKKLAEALNTSADVILGIQLDKDI